MIPALSSDKLSSLSEQSIPLDSTGICTILFILIKIKKHYLEQKPIIATKLGGSMETIVNNKTGILYKFDDPRELAKNINSFMETDKLALNIMGVEGRKNVVKKFDVEKMCQSTFNEYKKLLNL